MKIVEINKENFDKEVKEAKVPVLLDFWAPWCIHCRRIAPVLERLAEKYDGRLVVAKANVDDNPELSMMFQVNVIPTLVLFKEGQAVDTTVAPPSQAALEDWMNGYGI